MHTSLAVHDLPESYFASLNFILGFVHGTLDHGLQLHASFTHQLTVYMYADWVSCYVTRHSTSGYCVFIGGKLLSWYAKQHVTLSQSNAEAEYWVVVNVIAETTWIRNLLREIHAHLFTATLAFFDNVSNVYMSTNPVQH
ncbi:ribonuclease H-like domain-containing protein [Tanacetum coccineum]